MQKITVTISSAATCHYGKTTIAALIYKTLRENDLDCNVICKDKDIGHAYANLESCVKGMKNKNISVEIVDNNEIRA